MQLILNTVLWDSCFLVIVLTLYPIIETYRDTVMTGTQDTHEGHKSANRVPRIVVLQSNPNSRPTYKDLLSFFFVTGP